MTQALMSCDNKSVHVDVRGSGVVQKVKALNRRAEEKYPLLKDLCGKDGTAVIKKKIMMLFVNASKREALVSTACNAFFRPPLLTG